MNSKKLINWPRKPWRNQALRWLGWLLVIIIVVAPRVLNLNIFYARDELAIWSWADDFARAVWRGDPAATLTACHYPGIPMFWAQTLFLAVKYNFPALFPQTALPLDMLATDRSIELLAERRLVAGLLVSGQLIAVIGLVYRLFGRWVALLAAILLALDPFSLSEARLLRLEMVSALFVCLSGLAYLLYLRGHRRRWLLVSGVIAGLAVSSKTSAGLMVPYIWLLLALDFFFDFSPPMLDTRPWPVRLKRLLLDGLLWAGLAGATFWLIWPAMWVIPGQAIDFIFFAGLSKTANLSVWGDTIFFWGQTIAGGDPGPWFYPVVFAFRTTPLIWLGLIAAIGLLGWSIYKAFKSKTSAAIPWSALAVGLLLAQIVIIWLQLSLVVSKVDRYLILIFPILNILSAIGLAALIEGLPFTARLTRASRLAFAVIVVIVLLAAQLSLTLPAHPYYFTYWNPWAGGGQAAMAALPIGSGEGVDQAMNFLNSQPGAAESSLVCGASAPWCQRIFKGQTIRSNTYTDGRWAAADYVSFYISHSQRQNYPQEIVNFFKQQTPLYRVELQGVDYMQVYTVPKMDYFAGEANDLTGLGRLHGYNLFTSNGSPANLSTVKAGDTLKADIWWTNLGAGVDNLALRLVDGRDYEWAKGDVIPQPAYANLPAAQKAIIQSTATLTIPAGTPPGPYALRLGMTAPNREELLGEFILPVEGHQITVIPGGASLTDPLAEITYSLNLALSPQLHLLGYNLSPALLTPVTPAWLALYWQVIAPPPAYQVMLRLLDKTGQEVARWQGTPGRGYSPTETWQPGARLKDVWALQVPPETPVGEGYTLTLALVNPGQTSDAAGQPLISNLQILPQPVRFEVPPMQVRLDHPFDNRLTLLGYDLYFDADSQGHGQLAPVFYWQSQADFKAAFEVELTLRAADTGQIVQNWRVPLGVGEAKTEWQAQEVVQTPYQLPINVPAQGHYHLDITVFESGRPAAIGSTVTLENIQDKMVVRVTAGH